MMGRWNVRIWRGNVCRHMICVVRRTNRLSYPVEWFHPMWIRDFESAGHRTAMQDQSVFSLESTIRAPRVGSVASLDDARLSTLTAKAKELFVRCIGDTVSICQRGWLKIKATAVDAYILYCRRLDSLVSAWFTAAPNADAAQIADRMARNRCRSSSLR
jgi:hypothetical protein